MVGEMGWEVVGWSWLAVWRLQTPLLFLNSFDDLSKKQLQHGFWVANVLTCLHTAGKDWEDQKLILYDIFLENVLKYQLHRLPAVATPSSAEFGRGIFLKPISCSGDYTKLKLIIN
ncbi:hypothetical protein Pfo_009857 [Paulownia fortunei]|nr:hypothetical protein Pfo_009857 [Paulownia fortunei]